MQVDAVIGDGIPSMEQVRALPYTTRVISEAMRLYPQPPVLIRRALEEDNLAGYAVAPGSDLFISVWNLHRCSHRLLLIALIAAAPALSFCNRASPFHSTTGQVYNLLTMAAFCTRQRFGVAVVPKADMSFMTQISTDMAEAG